MKKVPRIGIKNTTTIYFLQRHINWEYVGLGTVYTTFIFNEYQKDVLKSIQLPELELRYKQPINLIYATIFQYEDGRSVWRYKAEVLDNIRLIGVEVGNKVHSKSEKLNSGAIIEETISSNEPGDTITFHLTRQHVAFKEKWPFKQWPPYGFISDVHVAFDIKHQDIKLPAQLTLEYARVRIFRVAQESINTDIDKPRPTFSSLPFLENKLAGILKYRIYQIDPVTVPQPPTFYDKIVALPWLENKEWANTGNYNG